MNNTTPHLSFAADRLQWCFSSLGCADFSLDEIIALARINGIKAIELRAFSGSLDLPGLFDEYKAVAPDQYRAIIESGIIKLIDTSFNLAGSEEPDFDYILKLAQLAEKSAVSLNYEAAVGAAIPIVKTLREGLIGNSINRIYGILNGTCNYILTRMEQEKLSFAECLKQAQQLGYAEANPAFDIEGHDTAQKLSLLASLAFGTKVDQSAIYVEGISSIAAADLAAADELGYRVKLLGVAVKTPQGIEQRVHPTMVRKDSSIAQVMGVTNAVTIDADGINPITLVGPGAGGAATASAVLSDIADVARGHMTPPFGRPTASLSSVRKAPMQRHEGGYYIRLMARDKPGTAASIATRLAEQEISLESIVQRHPKDGPSADTAKGSVPVILITYATSEDGVRKALAAVGRDKVISGRPQVIRIEKN